MTSIHRKRTWLVVVLSLAGCDDGGAAELASDPSVNGPTSDTAYSVSAGAVYDAPPLIGDANKPIDGVPARSLADDAEAEDQEQILSAEDAGTPEPAPAVKLPPVTSITRDGPFATTVDASAGPGRAGLVVRPTTLGANGLKHPIFIWGPGGGTRPRNYESLMRRIASHGFVVYSEVSRAADGTEMRAAMTWLISENKRSGSPYYQHLDESKIGVGGHSFGSNSAMTASSDPRVKAFIHTAGSGFRGAGKARNLKQPAAFICGEDDPTANVTDCRTDYAQTSSPVFFTVMANEDHLSTPRAGLPIIVAWLRWHLGGESERRSMFIGPDCDFCKGVYTSQSKNW